MSFEKNTTRLLFDSLNPFNFFSQLRDPMANKLFYGDGPKHCYLPYYLAFVLRKSQIIKTQLPRKQTEVNQLLSVSDLTTLSAFTSYILE